MTVDDPILGIDLGTTNSLVAIYRNGAAEIIPDGDSRLIPSVVAFNEDGRATAAGQRAKTLKSVDPTRVLYSVKRLMGRAKEDLASIATDLPFDFSESDEQMIRIKVGKRTITPIEVSAEVLKRCKFVAENLLGRPVSKTVITVPAYFNDSQRLATAVAGKLAGLEIVRIVNEPTAAALAYGISSGESGKTIAVYDFGGGTFDISILKVTKGIFEVLSTEGDTALGGDDLDLAFSNLILEKVKKRPATSEDQSTFMSQVEAIKRALTESSELEASIHWGNEIQWSGKISREEFEKRAEDLVNRTLKSCAAALEAAKISVSEIDEVILVGGSTRVPLVQKKVTEFFKKTPRSSINPDEVVALGAAVQASILQGSNKETLLLDVVPLSLGLESIGGVVNKIIHRNSTIPCVATEMFTTSVDNQTAVDFHIVQGEREFVKDCRSLGKFKLRIPPQMAGAPKIQVSFTLDANGILKVKAIDQKNLKEASLDVKPSFGLSDDEVEKMLKDAWDFASQDLAERQWVDAKNQAESLLRAIEKSLRSPVLDADFIQKEKARLMPVMKALKVDLESRKPEVLLLRIKELDLLTHSLAEEILNRSVQQKLQHKNLESLES